MLLRAAVADIWGFPKLVTDSLLVILTQLVAKAACGATLRTVGLVITKVMFFTIITLYAPVMYTIWCILIAECGTITDLSGNS